MRHYNIPVFLPHLGCPFKCIFCDQEKIASRNKIPSIDDVIKIIEGHLATIPSESTEVELAFFGGNFTAIEKDLQREYLLAVYPYIVQNRINGIRISTRPDFIDEPILTFLQANGVKTIELGVQSLNDGVLKTSKRGYLAEDVFKASHLIRKKGFRLGIQLMIGLPGDNRSLAIETAKKVIAIRPDMVRIYPTLVIADTFLEKMFKRGEYQPLNLFDAISLCVDMLLMFQKEEISVIRMGLQPSKDLQKDGTVVAGPYHPSFGELVEQEIFKEQAEMLIAKYFLAFGTQKAIKIYLNPKDISKMVGNRKANISYLKHVYGLDNIAFKPVSERGRDWLGIGGISSNSPQNKIDRTDLIYSHFQE